MPGILSYQGRVTVSGSPFSGNGQFKFALVNAIGGSTFWSHDASSTAGSEPTSAVTLSVANGLYSVFLGANMTAIPASVFDNSDVRLRVWFNDGTNGFQLLTPDQRIAAAGYAMRADAAATALSVPDNAISAAKIANDAVTAAKIPDGSITQAKLAFAVGGVSSGAQEYATAGTSTFTVPPGVTKIMVELWGAGAGFSLFGDGGSGAYSRKTLTVTPGSQWTVVVGAGGATLAEEAVAPSGGNTSFTSVSTPSNTLVSQGGRGAPNADGPPVPAQPDASADIKRTGPLYGEAVIGSVSPPLVATPSEFSSMVIQRFLSAGAASTAAMFPSEAGMSGYVLIQW
ncbi:glycine-rich domain-containing protein [Brevifollis gellanilyticus]|uniref:glycine-rich domain-containing protein n=1 Tax=Brevifollis gellanilyticus TaxID=748831 RepID=UPI0011BF2971|nr:hypothetical protein [Brevifollis gellanilyticus]